MLTSLVRSSSSNNNGNNSSSSSSGSNINNSYSSSSSSSDNINNNYSSSSSIISNNIINNHNSSSSIGNKNSCHRPAQSHGMRFRIILLCCCPVAHTINLKCGCPRGSRATVRLASACCISRKRDRLIHAGIIVRPPLTQPNSADALVKNHSPPVSPSLSPPASRSAHFQTPLIQRGIASSDELALRLAWRSGREARAQRRRTAQVSHFAREC